MDPLGGYDVDLTLFRHKQTKRDIEDRPAKTDDPFYSPCNLTTYLYHTRVAQSVEQTAVNRKVGGSSPPMGAITDEPEGTGTLQDCLGAVCRKGTSCTLLHLSLWRNGIRRRLRSV